LKTIFGRLLEDRIELIERSINDAEVSSDGHIKGTAAEVQLRALLSEFVPPHVGIARGWIYNKNDERTSERDAIVYSKNRAPGFLFAMDSGLIPYDAVRYDIQVKSRLTTERLKKTFCGFLELTPRTLLNVVIAASSSFGTKPILEAYKDIDPKALTEPVIPIFACGSSGYFYCNRDVGPISRIIPQENIKTKEIDLETLQQEQLTVCSWNGFHSKDFKKGLKGFLQGFCNSLFETSFGTYLGTEDDDWRCFSITVIDAHGSVLFEKTDFQSDFQRNYVKHLELRASKNPDGTTSISLSDTTT
jgi:hypothetical protein